MAHEELGHLLCHQARQGAEPTLDETGEMQPYVREETKPQAGP